MCGFGWRFITDVYLYLFCFYLVRQKSKDIISFLHDDERLRDARKTARKNRDKYIGISSSESSEKYSKYYMSIYGC